MLFEPTGTAHILMSTLVFCIEARNVSVVSQRNWQCCQVRLTGSIICQNFKESNILDKKNFKNPECATKGIKAESVSFTQRCQNPMNPKMALPV